MCNINSFSSFTYLLKTGYRKKGLGHEKALLYFRTPAERKLDAGKFWFWFSFFLKNVIDGVQAYPILAGSSDNIFRV